MQASLFDLAPLPGLHYRPDILSSEEAAPLLRRIAALELAPFEFQGWLGRRRVTSFGWRYDFTDARFAEAPPIPDWLLPLRVRVAALADTPADAFAQVLVTEYRPGAGIGWHRDRPVFDLVAGVSLLAPCTLRFRRRGARGFVRAALPLAPRSAYLITGEARHDWEHGIAELATLRYSLTFRTLAAARR